LEKKLEIFFFFFRVKLAIFKILKFNKFGGKTWQTFITTEKKRKKKKHIEYQ
jgi:hypothetical protein